MQQYSLETMTAELDLLFQRLQQLQTVELVQHGKSVGILLSTPEYQRLRPRESSPAKALRAFRATADQEALEDLDTAMFSQERHQDQGREVVL